MSDDTYNGWTNYETWNWKLWMDNDEGWQDMILEAAKEFKGQPYEFSQYLKENCEEMQELYDLPTTGPFADLLGAAIGSINFYEIADSILEDLE